MTEIEQLRADIAEFRLNAPYVYRANQAAEGAGALIERVLNVLAPAQPIPAPAA